MAVIESFTGPSTPLYVSNTTDNPSNVLNTYRSYTYNFTLAGANVSDLSDPVTWRKNSENYIILKSGGKGTAGINLSAGLSPLQTKVSTPQYGFEETEAEYAARSEKAQNAAATENAKTISGVNQDSPGKFDMFIDQVEIETTFSFDQVVATTLANGFNFVVFEPYSMNGFLEALQATALATGYMNYMSAKYVLKMEFLGYPDDVKFPEPEVIPETTRYFLINFHEVGIEVTERGTMYRCKAGPTTDMAFADAGIIKEAGSATGITVAEILADVATKMNEVNASSARERSAKNYDKISIIFPNLKPGTEELDIILSTEGETAGLYVTPNNAVNDIGSSKLGEPSRDTSSSGMITPEEAQQKNQDTNYQIPKDQQTSSAGMTDTKFDPSTQKFQVQYHDGANIHGFIGNVIRDSEYIKNLLKTLGTEGTIDEYGYINYFIIVPFVTYTKEVNTESFSPYRRITYVVRSYKVHISNTPGYSNMASNFKSFTVREYNYLYTGKNIDVINFKLNFDALFAMALPVEMNNETVSAKNAAGPDNSVTVEKPKTDVKEIANSRQVQPNRTLTVSQSYVPEAGSGLPKSDDPYTNLARNFHQAMLNSTKSMATGELEILGDPIYIATSGQGNTNPGVEAKGFTVNGEVNHTASQIPIRINFRNPIDIGENGWYKFSENLIPFSGIYAVQKVKSYFSEGIFKQRLAISRLPGQPEKPTTAGNNFTDTFKQTANPLDQVATDSTDAKPYKAGEVSADVLKRLGVALQTNLGTAATAVAAAAILKSVTGKNSAAIAGAIVAGGGLTVAKNLLATASTLGSTPIAKLVGGSGAAVAATSNVAPSIPDPTDVQSRAKDGVAVELLDTKTIANLPPSAPKSTAPDAVPDRAMLETIAREGGSQALAKAYGVKDVSQISSDLVPPDILKTALAAVPAVIANPFDYVKKVLANTVDTTVITNKIESASTVIAGATTVNIIPKDATQVTSVGNQFGSNSSGNSPLDKINIG